MHLALFCAAATVDGPYCAGHRTLCRLPGDCDPESLAAEIEAAVAIPP